jgi:hypothetical protein
VDSSRCKSSLVKNNSPDIFYLYKILKFDFISLGLEAAFWNQPKMLTATPLKESCKQGGLGAVNFELSLNETFKIVGTGGYKTAGFIEGMPLKSSAIVRAGLKLDL